MAQTIDGAMPFERAQPSFQDILAPWLAFVARATVKAELYAVTHAIDALCCEQDKNGGWSLMVHALLTPRCSRFALLGALSL